MSFAQIEFLGFFPIVFALYWALRDRRWQNRLLVVASAVFYGWVHLWFLGLLYGTALVDWTVALAIARRPEHKRALLVVSLGSNLTVLGFFKYFDFFVVNVGDALHALGLGVELHVLGLVLPVGISFYTFQTMSYTIDVYRGVLRPRRDLLDYLAYVSYFPQLVAGPIERATRLLPQLERPRTLDAARLRSGLGLALWGGFKKVALADTLAPYVDKSFTVLDPAGPLVWCATIAFIVQLYCDFSGYTDIARGISRLLGIELSENFDRPHLAVSTPDFWRRWHITLSQWFRDYLLAPLLGERTPISPVRFAGAVLATFVLIGLWHGARWNYVLFGVWHGLWMCAYGAFARWGPGEARLRDPWIRPAATVFHWLVVLLPGTMLFREVYVDRAVAHLTKIPWQATPDEWMVTGSLAAITAAVAAPLVVAGWAERWLAPRLAGSRWALPVETTVWAAWVLAIGLMWRPDRVDFVYFQF
ncbi:MAG: MBOAT family O-acyltransferase [Myxococcota bacterium]